MGAAEPGGGGPLPVPAASELAGAEKLIKDIYKSDFTRKSAADRQALAQKFLQRARETREPACRFILFRESRELAAATGDLKTGLASIEEMARAYQVSAADLKLAFLTTVSRAAAAPTAARGVTEAWLNFGEEAVAAGDYALAGKAASQAENTSRNARDAVYEESAKGRAGDLKRLQQEFGKVKGAAEKLKKEPQDPESNLALGRFHCLVKGDWESGLPLLAKGSNELLKALAAKELARPGVPQAQLVLGDGWWDQSLKESGAGKSALQARACHWYRKALAGLPEAERATREARIAQAAESSGTRPEGPAAFVEGEVITTPLLGGLELKTTSVLSATDRPYTINGRLSVSKAKEGPKPLVVTVRPRVEIVGGTFELGDKGLLVVEGSPQMPVVLRKIRIVQELGARLKARHAIFDQCTFVKGGGWFADYSSKWEFDSCLLHNCKFPKLTEVDYGFRFKDCTFLSMTFPEIEHPHRKDRPYDDMRVLRSDWNRIESCTFFGCTVPPTVFWCATGSNFLVTKFIPGKPFESQEATEILAYVAETEGPPPQKVFEQNPAPEAPLTVKNAEKPFPCFRFPGPLPLSEARGDARFRKWYGAGTRKH